MTFGKIGGIVLIIIGTGLAVVSWGDFTPTFAGIATVAAGAIMILAKEY